MKDTASTLRILDAMIRSRSPVICIGSHEEDRIIELIQNMAAEPVTTLDGNVLLDSRRVFQWTTTQGLRQIAPQAEVEEHTFDFDRDMTMDPLAAFSQFTEMAQADGTRLKMRSNAAILIMCDLHRIFAQAIEGGRGDHMTMRAIRDVYSALAPTHSVAILLSPTIPDLGDAERQVEALDWPLPTVAELTMLVRDTARRLPEHIERGDMNGGAEILARALAGLTWAEAKRIVLRSVTAAQKLTADDCLGPILAAKAEAVRRVQGIEYIDARETLADVGGLDVLKGYARKLPQLLTEEAREKHIRPPRGFLFVGPPGTGKSLLAKAISQGTMPVLRWDPGASMSKWVGQSEAQTRQVLKTAEAIGHCVLWIDEAEKQLGGGGGETDGGTREAVMGTVLTWLQERESHVIVVMTVNQPANLRPELVDRFDSVWFVDFPDEDACAEIIGIHTRKREVALSESEIADLAGVAFARELNGREIEHCIEDAMRNAFYAGRDMTAEDLQLALSGKVGVAHSMSTKIAALRDWGKGKATWASTIRSRTGAEWEEALIGV